VFSADEIFEISRARERSLSRLLILYIMTGLAFMLLPGTFLGVWNLLAISWPSRGRLGFSRLGAGTRTRTDLRVDRHLHPWHRFLLDSKVAAHESVRTAGSMDMLGPLDRRHQLAVAHRHLPVAVARSLPFSAVLELTAFLIFFSSVSGHRPKDASKKSLEKWVWVVIAATIGLLATLVVNFGTTLFLAVRGTSPDVPAAFDQRFLVLETWGFLVPFVWGFSARWLPVFLGLRPTREPWLLGALGANSIGVLIAMAGWIRPAAAAPFCGMLISVCALRLFESAQQPSKTKGVHSSFQSLFGWHISGLFRRPRLEYGLR
jgi:hypothetical protein